MANECCFNPRGGWDRLVVYSPLDLVSHEGSSYICLVSNIGDAPTFFSTVWMVLAEKGDPGQLNPRGIWQRSVVYDRLDVVSYQGSSWIARRESIGRAPAESSFWMLLAERGMSIGGAQGAQGDTGPAGSAGPPGAPGPQNLFVQPTDPGMTSSGLWIETTAVGGDVVTFWVETG